MLYQCVCCGRHTMGELEMGNLTKKEFIIEKPVRAQKMLLKQLNY